MKITNAALSATLLSWGLLACGGGLESNTGSPMGSGGTGDPTMMGAGGSTAGTPGTGGTTTTPVMTDPQGRVVDWQGTVICDPAVRGAECDVFAQLATYDVNTPSFGRLNNRQYNNTVRDLFGTTATPADDFPNDELALGFDTIGATLRVQPEHVEKYLPASGTLVAELFARAATDPLRTRYLGCDFAAADCQQTSLKAFASKAWRRPALDEEISPYVTWIATQVTGGYTVEEAMQGAVRAVLMSPNFMYRIELDPNPADLTPHALGAYELASRLSYFLWSTMPDDALLASAAAGTLTTDAGLHSELQRVLGDTTRVLEVVDQFGLQWLNVYRVLGVAPDPNVYQSFSPALQQAMFEETRLVLTDFLAGTQPLKDLLTANFTFVDSTLAAHYGFPAPAGPGFSKVDTTGTTRMGILTHGSFLVGTSNPTRTSPVKRGRHVLERLLCSAPPDPPGDIDLNIDDGSGLENLPIREKLEQHQLKGAGCAACHVVMDAIGLGLENYDGIGTYRDQDEFGAIDASGELPSTTDPNVKVPFTGLTGLAPMLASDPRLMPCVVEKLLTFGMGRKFDSADANLKRALGITAEAYGGHFRSTLEAIVMSSVFRNRRAGTAPAPVGG
ncbi:MAG TPA: DUF1592 domain-containing protein [Polyangiaceae bacterium]|nr:DUF1592 domain-containing protein [Polyangiaceae bacterium]